jgi:hypothetical protein
MTAPIDASKARGGPAATDLDRISREKVGRGLATTFTSHDVIMALRVCGSNVAEWQNTAAAGRKYPEDRRI